MAPSTDARPEWWAMARRALPEFGLKDATLAFVSESENIVFRVEDSRGRRYALRLHRPGYHTLDALESELAWTRALHDSGLPVARAMRTPAGEGYVQVVDATTGASRLAGIVEWSDGESLRRILPAPRDSHPGEALTTWYHALGALAARMHEQAVAWRPPPGFERHRLDASGFVGERPFWGRFWEVRHLTPGERSAFEHARRRIGEALTDGRLEAHRYSLIHADLHPGNLLVTQGGLHVLDFDDAGFGWHHYDLAVALYDYEGTTHYEAARDALVAGYRTRRALDDRAVEELPLFCLIRTLALIGRLDERPELWTTERLRELVERACQRIGPGKVLDAP